MLVERSGQTATLLSDGDVLLVGGSEMPEGKESTKTAEIYDPATNTWTAAPAPAELEEAQSATLLSDGRVLLIGLFKGQPFPGVAGAAIYDPASDDWRRAAPPRRFRYGSSVTLLPDGKVIVMGGWHGEQAPTLPVETKYTVFASVEEYDPATDAWSELAPMNHARADHAATLMPDGEVLVTGGIFEVEWGGPNDYLNSLTSTEIYDQRTNSWSTRASMLIPRAQDTATLMKDGMVLVVGGYDCGFARGCLGYGGSGDCCGASSAEVYDPTSNTWEYTGPVLTGDEHTATLLPEGGVLVTGGNVGPISMYELSSAEIYGPVPPPKAAAPTPPSITRLAETHKRWREGRASARITARKRKARRAGTPLGTTFTFTLNEQASVTFTFTQQLPGRTVKSKCGAQSRKNRRRHACERTVTRGALTFTGHAGRNTISFQGRLSRAQKLPPSRYELVVTARNTSGQSVTKRLWFVIVNGPGRHQS